MRDATRLLEIVGQLYQGAAEGRFVAAMASYAAMFGGERGGLYLWEGPARRIVHVDTYEISEDCQRSHATYASLPDLRPLWQARLAAAASDAVLAEIHAERPEWRNTAIYDAWLVPQRMDQSMRAHLQLDPTCIAMLALSRDARSRPFDPEGVAMMQLLQPHLKLALQLGRRLATLERDRADALEALDLLDQGVFVVDGSCRILFASRCGERMLRACDGIVACGPILACELAKDTVRLQRTVHRAVCGALASGGGPLALRRGSGSRPLSALVAPFRTARPTILGERASAIVIVRDPEPRQGQDDGSSFQAAYGLTAAEARVARAVGDCHGLAQVAATLGISLSTVRTLLQRAFQKTDTHRQTDLVRLMLAHRLPGTEQR